MNKWRKKLLVLTSFACCLMAVSGCSSEDEKVKNPDTGRLSLTIRNPKVEIAGEFERMISVYENENPKVEINLETVGGASDDFSDIRAKIAAGEGPDIFTNVGSSSVKEWISYLEDLSGEPWVNEAFPHTLDSITLGGNVYGMPVSIEGFGVIYNRDLFKKAGITTVPDTFTELKAAAVKLKSAGITPFANGYYEDWKLGHHMASLAFLQQGDPEKFIGDLKEDKADFKENPAFHDLFSLLDLTVQYGNSRPAATDYYTEVELFTSGNAAMILQGNWIQPLLDQKGVPAGIFPVPLNDKGKTKILAGVTNYWVINKQAASSEKKEAKKFLNWMVSSETGRKFLTESFQFIPAFKQIPAQSGPIGQEVLRLTREEGAMNWPSYPPCIKQELGEIMKSYIVKEKTQAEALQAFDQAWKQGNCSGPLRQ